MIFLHHMRAKIIAIMPPRVIVSIQRSVMELIISWHLITTVRYAVFFLRNFFFNYLLGMFTKIQETDHSSEFSLYLALIVTAHQLLEFVSLFFDDQILAVGRLNRAKEHFVEGLGIFIQKAFRAKDQFGVFGC